MKRLILLFATTVVFLSCGKEKKTEQENLENPSVEEVEKNEFVVLLNAIYEKDDTCKVFIYDENDNEVLNEQIKVAVKGSSQPQTVEFKLPVGYVPYNLGVGFSCSNKEQESFIMKGIIIKNGEELVYQPEDYLKYYANNDQVIMDVATGVYKLKHDQPYPGGFVGNTELKSALTSAVK